MDDKKMTRKEARQLLDSVGAENPFTLRTVNFNWGCSQVLTVKDWHPSPKAREIDQAFEGTGIVVSYESADGVVFVS